MAYVLYTPPVRNVAANLATAGAPQRALGRMWGPLRVGYTQFRIDGQWYQKAVPTTDESLAVDTDTDGQPLFLRGGHWQYIREELLTEIDAAGLDLGEYLPRPEGFYPSESTFPSESLFPPGA